MVTESNGKKLNILIVDDDQKNVRILEEILEDAYRVKSATDGMQTLECLGSFSPDIILLDIRMPGMDGLGVCRRIRADEQHRFIKIILISAHSVLEDRLRGYQAGADDYICKPFDEDELLMKLRVFARLKFVEESDRALHEEKTYQRGLVGKLKDVNKLLMQSEKMASIGQLAAGVAHEINNPVGYVCSNLTTLEKYVADISELLDTYERLEELVPEKSNLLQKIRKLKQAMDIEYIKEDLSYLVNESRDGVARVREIVQNLKDFSHVDKNEWQWTDLHKGIDSTLNIVNNEIKYKADIVKEYGELPDVECMASQLNQVFMNLLVNAAHAMKDFGTITVSTGVNGDDWVWVNISDTGSGIPDEQLDRIFDPFFTTKPVGTGTGLGLSLSYSIVQKHGGRIEVDSELGKGTTFTILVPVRQSESKALG